LRTKWKPTTYIGRYRSHTFTPMAATSRLGVSGLRASKRTQAERAAARRSGQRPSAASQGDRPERTQDQISPTYAGMTKTRSLVNVGTPWLHPASPSSWKARMGIPLNGRKKISPHTDQRQFRTPT
jgi:hypothetical protein